MGKGFWIIVYDGYGSGCNLINPRLHHEGDRNWWAYETRRDIEAHLERMKIREKYGTNFSVVDNITLEEDWNE